MAQVINTNLASLNAQRNLDKSQTANQTAMQRLSSGLRINSAKDDAAGMAISTRFTSQIKGLNVAVRNAGDGIALAQTAEGALGSMNDNLQRIRELAVQSANGSNSEVDREALQAEVEQLVAEITRTANETDFNGRKLLDGSFSSTFQIGANAGQTLDINIAELTADKLGSSAKAGVSAQGTDQKLSNGDLIINGADIRSSVAEDDKLSYTDKEKSGIAKVEAINASSAESGVTATVDENVVLGSKIENGTAGTAVSGSIKLNGVDISLQGTDNTNEVAKAGTRQSVVAAINAKAGQTGVTAEDGGANGGVILRAADGRNITIELSGATTDDDLAGLGLSNSGTSYAGFTLTAANANTEINIKGGNGTGNGDIANAGLKIGNYKAQQATTSNTAGSIAGFDLPTVHTATSFTLTQTPAVAFGNAGAKFDFEAINAAFAKNGVEFEFDATKTGAGVSADIVAALGNAFEAAGLPKTGTGAPTAAPDGTTPANDVNATDAAAGTFWSAVAADLTKLEKTLAIGEQEVAKTETYAAGNTASGEAIDNTSDATVKASMNAILKELGIEEFGDFGARTSGTDGNTADYNARINAAFKAMGSTETSAIAAGNADGSDVLAAATHAANIATDLTKLAKAKAEFDAMLQNNKDAASDRALQDGDLVINGVTIAASSALDDTSSYTGAASSDGAASAIAIAAAINKSSEATGVKAEINATEFVGKKPEGDISEATKGNTLGLTINGVDIELVDQGDYEKNKAAAISAINERAGETGVTASDNGVSLTLTAADGRNISLYAESAAKTNTTGAAGEAGTEETAAKNFGLSGLSTTDSKSVALDAKNTSAMTVYGTVTLSSSKAFEVSYGTGGEKGLADTGLVAGKFGGGEDGQALTEIDISTFEGAQKALTAIDNAIAQVASQRADLGAIQNRMESTVSNLKVTSENLSAANSRILDADFAAETAEMARTQILQQAGISILAQANASGQNVLSLLG